MGRYAMWIVLAAYYQQVATGISAHIAHDYSLTTVEVDLPDIEN